MAKKKNSGDVGYAVAQAVADAQPTGWAGRWKFDPQTEQVVPRNDTSVPALFNYVNFEQGNDGKTRAVLPSLAHATASINWGGQSDWNGDHFAFWENFHHQHDDKMDIRKAIRWYRKDPLVFKCVMMLATLANSTLNISCPNEGFEDIIDNWREVAMPHSFMQAWFIEYFRTGMVPVLKTLVPYVPRDYKTGKIPATGDGENVEATPATASAEKTEALVERNRRNLDEYRNAVAALDKARANSEIGLCSSERLAALERAVAIRQYEWQKGTLPGAYTILDPLLVDMDGPKEMGLLRAPHLQVSGELAAAVTAPTPQQQAIVSTLPQEIVAQIRRGSTKVWLSPNICTVTFGDKQPYERYPTPLAVHAFEALEMKAELQSMDRATARSLKNRILLVKLGTDEYPEFDNNKINTVQRMFLNPSKNMTLVWNHCISLEWVEPNADSLQDQSKYTFWNSEIRTVYGISQVLTGTSETSGQIGNSIMNFKGLQECVAEAQKKFVEFVRREIKMVKAALGVSAHVEVDFDQLNLKDETAFWGVLSQAVMNGLIDHQTALETLRFNFPTIAGRMEKMKKLKEQGLFMPIPSANNLGPGGDALPAKGGIPTSSSQGGKPKKSPTADNNKNRAGKPARLKAAAKIVPVDDSTAAIVVDVEELGDQERRDVAEWFSTPLGWVMTKAEYESSYGAIDFTPPWPQLSSTETIGAIRASAGLMDEFRAGFEKLLDAHKSKDTGGQRKPYVTERVTASITETALAQVSQSYVNRQLEEYPEQFDRYLDEEVQALAASQPDMGETDRYLTAVAMTVSRRKKLLAK